MNHWKWIYACGILMFKFNILHFNIGFQRKPEKTYIWKKVGNMELRNRNFSTAFCSMFHIFHIFHNWSHFFTCSKHIFHFFQAHVQNAFVPLLFQKNCKKCEQGAFWTCTWKCEKMRFENALGKMWNIVENVENNIWNPVGKVELWFFSSSLIFLGPVLLQLLCCLPNFCRLKIRENRSEVDCADRRSV